MNTTDNTTAAPFRVDAIYNPAIEGIYYEVEIIDAEHAAIRDRSGFVSRPVEIGNELIDAYGYAIPLSGLTYTTQQPPFVCSVCNETKQVEKGSMTTGYGTDRETGDKTCFQCIGRIDREKFANMRPGERDYLYLSGDTVSNWPGTFTVNVMSMRTSRHNFGCKRRDFWFWVNYKEFHGYQIGEFTQVAHIRRTNRVWNPELHKYTKETASPAKA